MILGFLDGLNGSDFNIYPVVQIGDKYYSTNNTHFNGNYCIPIISNIPSIKQSINIENKRFKISSVVIEIHNHKFEGVRFSDSLSTNSLINESVVIYYVNGYGHQEVYRGWIRSIAHNDVKVKVSVEDRTQLKITRQIPTEIIPNNADILEKYRGVPIPMVYGYVDKSPVVVEGVDFNGDYNFLIDYKQIDKIVPAVHDLASHYVFPGFFIFDNIYASITDTQWEYVDGNNFLTFPKQPQADPDEEIGLVDLMYIVNTDQVKATKQEVNDLLDIGLDYPLTGNSNSGNLVDVDSKSYVSFDSDLFTSAPTYQTEHGVEVYTNAEINLIFNKHFGGSPISYNSDGDLRVKSYLLLKMMLWDKKTHSYGGISMVAKHQNGVHEQMLNVIPSSVGLSNLWDYTILNNIDPIEVTDYNPFPDDLVDGDYVLRNVSNNLKNTFFIISDYVPSQLRIGINSELQNFQTSGIHAEWRLFSSALLVEGRYEQKFDKKYYVSVNGRVRGGQLLKNPIDIVKHIIDEELDGVVVDEDSYLEARIAHTFQGGVDWEFGFTHFKKEEAKKVIEEILHSTKSYGVYKDDGTFKFITYKDNYNNADYDASILIDTRDIDKFTFKKTKPEMIYKKVDVQYKYDYGEKSFLFRTNARTDTTDTFYGIESFDDAYLEFESKYIRTKDTANALRNHLFNKFKNDSLLFSFNLPLRYINLEIGQLIRFNEIIDLNAYGIDYTVQQEVNGQIYYPVFLITSIKKSLNSVSVECMQLHQLSEDADQQDISEDYVLEYENPTLNIQGDDNIFVEQEGQYTEQQFTLPLATAVDTDLTMLSDQVIITYHNIFTGEAETYNNDGSEITIFANNILPIEYSVTSPTSGLTTIKTIMLYVGDTQPPEITVNAYGITFPGINQYNQYLGDNAEYGTWEHDDLVHVISIPEDAQVSDPSTWDYGEYYTRYCTDYYGAIQEIFPNVTDPDSPNAPTLLFGLDALNWLRDNTDLQQINTMEVQMYVYGITNVEESLFPTYTWELSNHVNVMAYMVAFDEHGNWSYYRWTVLAHIERDFSTIPGDVNFDGVLNILDVVNIVQQIAGDDPVTPESDFNQDGVTNVLDAVGLVNHILD